jgi:hypothetical protein
MFIRSLMLASALAFAFGCVAEEPAADQASSVTQQTGGGGFTCVNQITIQVVQCVGSVAVLPITVDIKDVRVLNDNELDILSNDLNYLSVLNGNILNYNTILNNLEVGVFEDFLNKFDIDVTKNDIDVCTAVLGISLCK